MDINIQTSQIDATVVLKAHKAYKSGDYQNAISALLEILDLEPNNWHARLFLAASYFKSAQYGAAQRAFRFMFDRCPDAELKTKACQGLQASTSRLERKIVDIPAEFGGCVERSPELLSATLDF